MRPKDHELDPLDSACSRSAEPQPRRSEPIASTVADISALDKYPCAACGAQAQWNPAKQLLVCPFCGTAAPFTVDAATGAIEELDLAKALREMPDEERGWQAEKRTVQCQSCKAVSVFDPERVGQNCDFCGSPALVDYSGDQGADPAAEPAAVHRHGRQRPRADPQVVREQVARARQAQEPGARRSRARRLHSLLDVRRAGRVPVGRRGRPLLLHDRDLSAKADARERARSGTCAGCRPPVRSSTSSTTSRSLGRAACRTRCWQQVEPFPTRELRAVRHGVSLRLRRRALPDRALRRRQAVPGCDDAKLHRDVRRRRFRAIPIATCRFTRSIPGRRSSTSSCPSGC